ncbi:serine carboxypeptidase 24, partial [Tanacetum coccineum]
TPPTTTIIFDDEDVTLAMAQTLIKMKEEKAKEKGVVITDVEDSSRPVRSITTLQPLLTINPKHKEEPRNQKSDEIAKDKKEKEELMLMLEKMEAKDMYVYKLTRADGSSSYHRDTQAFIRRLDRQDLNDLYSDELLENWKDFEFSMLPTYKELIAAGYKIWVFIGDTDSVVPVTSTRFSLSHLNLTVNTEWYPWYIKGQVGK